MKKTFLAVATLIGTIIGVGIFALPYAYNQYPPISLIMLVFAGLILLNIYYFYIDMISEKGMGVHQLPGIVNKLFGKQAQNVTAVFLLLARTAVLFLYTLTIGDFISILGENILGIQLPYKIISISIVFIISLILRGRIKSVSKSQLWLSWAIVLIILGTSTIGLFSRVLDPFESISWPQKSLDGDGFLYKIGILYGTSIGALSGIAATPSLKEIIKGRKNLMRVAVIGTSLVVLIYAAFILFVINSSTTVSMDALRGLGNHWWVDLLVTGGLICLTTSYLGLANSLFEVYVLDFKFNINLAWALTFFPPVLLYLTGFGDFVRLVALVGGVIGGIEGLIILASYWKEEKGVNQLTNWKKLWIIVIGTILIIGIGLSL